MESRLINKWKSREKRPKKYWLSKIKSISKRKGGQLAQKADKVHDQVFRELDCLDCANCCKSIPPMVSRSDAKRISKALGVSVNEFESNYLKLDEDGDLVMATSPCVFLESDNKCRIYDVRPKACRQYPHTDGFEFQNNLGLHAINVNHCPAVYHILLRMDNLINKTKKPQS